MNKAVGMGLPGIIRFWCLLTVWPLMNLNILLAQQVKSPWYQPAYVAKTWDNKSGLPQNTVFDIKKDETGFLWMGTEEGLVRFDGQKFEVFNETNLPSVSASSFYAISRSQKGGIWAANDHAVVWVYRNKTKTFDVSKHILNTRINCIAEDQQGRLWIGTNAGDLLCLQNNLLNKVKAWPFQGKRSVQVLTSVPAGLLIGTDLGLFQLSRDTNNLVALAGYETKYIRTLAAAPDGSLWVGTKEHGLFHHTKAGNINYTEKDGLPESFITSLAIAPDGRLWAGTSVSGVHQFNQGKFTPLKVNGIPEDGVRSILFADPDLIWLGTAASGLVLLKPPRVHMLSQNYPLAGNIILPIYEHQNGDIWVGTAGNGISRISKGKTNSFSKQQGLAADLILSIAGTTDAVFISTTSGLNRFNLHTNTIDRHYMEQDGLANNFILALFADKSETLWIATRYGGLQTLGRDGKITQVPLPPRLARLEFVSIFEDRQQNKWFGSRGAGMVRLSPSGDIKHYTSPQGLPVGVIDCFYEDKDGTLWLGTDKGLVCFTDNRFILLNKTNGLNFNGIYRILDDNKGGLWLSGTYGLQRISLRELEKVKQAKNEKIHIVAQLYDTSDGMNNSEVNGGIFPAGWKLQDGTLWFPTVNGVAIIDPDSFEEKKKPVNVHISAFRFGNIAQDLSKSITLPPGVNNIEIDYTCIDFTKPATINFYYRLKGVQEEWEFVDDRRTAYFTSLDPGDYTFEVKAEQNGIWSEPTQLSYTIKPFFYQTLWFRVFLLVLLFMAGYFVKKFHVTHLHGTKLKALIEARTKDLKESNDRFQLVNMATSDVIWDYDLIRHELYWGENIRHLLGHSQVDKTENLKLWQDNLHPEDVERVMDTFEQALNGSAEKWQEEYRFRKGDQQYAYIIDRGYILRNEQGKAIRMLGAMQDVTRLKEEEQRLKLLESVITNATDAVLITEAQLNEPGPRIIYVNEAFTKMTGYQKEEVIGLSSRLLQGEKSDPAELNKLKQALENGEACEIEIINYRKNGEEFYANMNVSPVTDQQGNLTHFIAIQRDFTERREYLKAIESQNTKLREIAWMQSHVVRAPVANILGLINLLQRTSHSQFEQQVLLDYIKISGMELDTIIRDIVVKAESVDSDVEIPV